MDRQPDSFHIERIYDQKPQGELSSNKNSRKAKRQQAKHQQHEQKPTLDQSGNLDGKVNTHAAGSNLDTWNKLGLIK